MVLHNNKTTIRPCPVMALIKSKYSGTTSNCNVTNSTNIHSICYEVACCGCHDVVMLVDGQEVPGSPFPFVASLSPTELGQPIKIWNQVCEPSDITTNSTGDILVADGDYDIIKFGKDGNKQTLVKKSRHSLTSPEGIALDSDDIITALMMTPVKY